MTTLEQYTSGARVRADRAERVEGGEHGGRGHRDADCGVGGRGLHSQRQLWSKCTHPKNDFKKSSFGRVD